MSSGLYHINQTTMGIDYSDLIYAHFKHEESDDIATLYWDTSVNNEGFEDKDEHDLQALFSACQNVFNEDMLATDSQDGLSNYLIDLKQHLDNVSEANEN